MLTLTPYFCLGGLPFPFLAKVIMSHVTISNRHVFNKAIMASFVILGWKMATEAHFATQAACIHSPSPLLDSQSKEGDRHGALFLPMFMFFLLTPLGFPYI